MADNLKRVLVFKATNRYGDNPFISEDGIYGNAVYTYSNPYRALKEIKDPSEIVVGIINPTKDSINFKKDLILIEDPKSIKIVHRFPATDLIEGKKFLDTLKKSLPEGLDVRRTKTLSKAIQSVLAKRKNKYRIRLPLRTRLDYGIHN